MSNEEVAEQAPAPRRSRRWLVMVVVDVLVLAVAAGGGVFIANYQPLHVIGFGPIPGGKAALGGSNGISLTYEDGQLTGYTFVLENGGRLGVTITAVQFNVSDTSLLRPTGVALGTPNSLNILPGTEGPFLPFSLGAGKSRAIEVQARFANCAFNRASGGENVFSSPTIAYRVLGITRHTSDYAHFRIIVKDPPASACPQQ